MDTTLLIILVVTIVVVIMLRLMLRSFRKRQVMKHETPSPEKITSIAVVAPAQAKPQVEKDEKAVEISRVYKSFGGNEVVEDVSFTIAPGEVFGLVGPNGAGKTTTIRIIMDIIKADSGEIRVFGQPLVEETKNRIGYLPEERGLYQKMRVSDSVVYLATLKNVEAGMAREQAEQLLRQVDMQPHKGKKIGELSRGMGQIIQFLVTIAHDPDLIVLDEPFAGLDPVNRKLLKDIVLELKGRGKAIILSTHMMNEVEEMCDRILMIDKGRTVLYGDLTEIKWRYRNNSVFVGCEGEIGQIDGVIGRKEHGRYVELFLDGETPPRKILSELVERKLRVDRFEVSTPSLNEVFLQVVGEAQ
ncbi:MAG: ABC transporter ATP-binding protein [Dehalococcoidia bacterium]